MTSVNNTPTLSVRNLSVSFSDSDIAILDSVSFDVHGGEMLGIVGESGCGKSLSALAVMGLLPMPPARILGGDILLKGTDLLSLPERRMRHMRGRKVAMIFQEPMTSLNPVFTIGNQLSELVVLHHGMGSAQARKRACELLEIVGIPMASSRLDDYPHQLSGGMRQRVMIAMALAGEPELLIADEPTTALDVTIQAQILEVLDDLRRSLGMAVVLITHDLGIVAEHCERVLVMYAGRVIESAAKSALFDQPSHPYTRGLLASIPRLDGPRERLRTIDGIVPTLNAMPPGCRFRPRCPIGRDECDLAAPDPVWVGPDHTAACIALSETPSAISGQKPGEDCRA